MNSNRSPITTHILDTQLGRAAAGVLVLLEKRSGDSWKELANGKTNQDGRIESFLAPGSKAEKGVYRLKFATAEYFNSIGTKTFYPEVDIVFEITDSSAHHHVPLLLSAFGYSTYRGT